MTRLQTFTAALFAALFAFAAQAGDFKGTVLLTVTGNVENATRTGYDAERDKFFGFNEVQFDQASQFDYDKLTGLPQVSIRADFPKDGPVHEFSGPLLADVLGMAGATGQTVTVQALDGYAAEAPLQEMLDQGAVVALSRDGAPLGIGDFGPTQIVFPRAERSDLKDMNDDRWVWSIFHIRVE